MNSLCLRIKKVNSECLVNEDDLFQPPPLENKGEICYLNSIVQALSSCSKMIKDLKQLSRKCQSHKLIRFIKLLEALNSRNAQEEYNEFMLSYGWEKEGQQDSFEMMTYFINSIFNEIKAEQSKDKDKQTFNKKWKTQILPGRINMSSQTKCSCSSNNKNLINDIALHLPLVNKRGKGITYNIENMIKTVLKEDSIDENCDKCKSKQTLVLSIEGEPPRTLCLHIQANRYDNKTESMIKPKYNLTYPFKLKVFKRKYRLVSFVEHLGGVSVGHYVAYRYCGKKWFTVNDSIVDMLPNKRNPNKYSSKPYVLFYELEDED